MLKLSLVVPDATINYIENPSARYDITGWNAAGATLTRSLDFARFGIASCKVVTAGTALREGVYYRVNALSGVSDPITVSGYVIGTGVVRIRLIDNPRGREWFSEKITLRPDRFQRLSISGTITGSNDVRVYIETDEGAAKARTFYVDGLQMERKAYATTYCDGDQPGCRWNGIYHNSRSLRAGDTRAGGRWVQLAGQEREEQDLYVTVVGGLGMAPLENNTQPFALEAGGFFQNTKVRERLITATFHAKHKQDSAENVISLAALHQLRQLLIDVIKSDRTGGDEELWFEYDDGTLPLYFKARYDGGLEGSWDVRNQWVNSFPLRLLAVSPFFEEDTQVTAALDFQDTVSINYVLGRIDGRWRNLNFGFNSYLDNHGGDIGPRGQVYMGGLFSVINNSAAAIAPTAPGRVAYWDGEKWVAIATALGGTGLVAAIAVAPNGDVYIGGDFTSVNGVAANRIAKYSIDTGLWSALSTGMNNSVLTIKIAPNGDIYAGGVFTTAGGVSCFRVARWDGLQWRRLGQYGGLDGTVYSIAITRDGSLLYVGGEFVQEQGVSSGPTDLNNIAEYNISTGLFSRMGEGLTTNIAAADRVRVVYLSDSGIVYTGGHFTLSGTTVLQNVAMWNGNAWQGLGNGLGSGVGGGLGDYVADLKGFSNGNLIAVGQFNSTGTVPLSKIALWNGSLWTMLDENFIITPTDVVGTCLIDPRTDDLFIAIGSNTGTGVQTQVSGITTVDNIGTREVAPVLYVLGPARIRWIENQNTRQRMYLNLDVLSNEEVFFDFARGTITSTVRGNLLYGLLEGSDFRSMRLLPGENVIAALMINDVAAKMQIYFTPQHWSVDATQSAESL